MDIDCCPICGNFNPRSHERSDRRRASSYDVPLISIHAPTRGATSYIKHLEFDGKISIHAPTRGATIKYYNIVLVYYYFNPRSHERSDRKGQKVTM